MTITELLQAIRVESDRIAAQPGCDVLIDVPMPDSDDSGWAASMVANEVWISGVTLEAALSGLLAELKARPSA